MSEGNYTSINFYRSTTLGGTYTYAGTTAATNDTFVDTGTTGTADTINEAVLNGQYKYYVAFGNASGVVSRPSELIELTSSVSDGRVHLTDLPSAGLNPNDWTKWIIYRNAPRQAPIGILNSSRYLFPPHRLLLMIFPIILPIPSYIPT